MSFFLNLILLVDKLYCVREIEFLVLVVVDKSSEILRRLIEVVDFLGFFLF